MPDSIYLDHNATAPVPTEVADAVREAALRYPGNPASQHEPGRLARRALETARESIAQLLGAQTSGRDADRLIFTSGGTESNNLALAGLLRLDNVDSDVRRADSIARKAPLGAVETPADNDENPRLIISVLEHHSIARTAERLARLGVEVRILGADSDGLLRVDQLDDLLPPPLVVAGKRAPGSPHTPQRRALVSVIMASNETGVIQPVAEISRLSGRRGVLVHTDASQAVGKIPVNFRELNVEALTAAAHKFHGPLGIGVLVLRHGVELDPVLYGGFQQQGLRPGTEPVALAIGMQTALQLAVDEGSQRRQRLSALRDQLEREILAGYPAAVVIGAAAPRLPNTSNIAFVGLDRQAFVMALDLAGVACSTGSACASGSSQLSPALLAMGLPEAQISSALRFSLGAATTADEVDEAARRIVNVCNHLRR